ncbi:trans-sialidase [Trypanosoma rangeli]|uniref:Trans-sialidase n=1 Tax=Trypanosoma rangeli TaxID=5698 RepID=A0A422MZQ4_TRYRA|nr:trans-sialidase [Trypanosoma rangeli]RNE98620.1 trans-sialidase [Trypanosoma rangeli]|eukprot:RNE98620.1 trans-sialidase [Trypanosoma rangeli]
MPKMSWHMFLYSLLLLLCVLLVCCGGTAVHAEEGNTPKEAQTPEVVDLFVLHRTIVETQGQSQTRESFLFPSLANVRGVLVTLPRAGPGPYTPIRELLLWFMLILWRGTLTLRRAGRLLSLRSVQTNGRRTTSLTRPRRRSITTV